MPVIVKSKELIAQGTSPVVRTNFGDQISLENRLRQVDFKTTQHLAQYFLSDVYTNYIKINKPKELEKVSPILITLPSATVAQGGTNPTIIRFIPEQGGTNIIIRNYDFLLRQGTTLSNGVYKSIIIPKESLGADSFLQSSKNYITITFPKQTVSQGNPVTPTLPVANLISIPAITPVIPNTNYLTFPQISLGVIAASYLTIPTIVLGKPTQPFILTGNQEFLGQFNSPITAFTNFDPNIGNKTIPIKTLGYTADRSLAFFAPEVKHGSEDPQNEGTSPVKNTVPFESALEYTNLVAQEITTSDTSQVNKINSLLNSRLSFKKLADDEKPYYFDKNGKEKKTYKEITNYQQIVDLTGKRNQNIPTEADVDEVIFTFTRISDQTRPTVSFTALLKNISDSYTVGTSDVKFVGKQDTIKLYTGTTRQLSLGFMAVALGKAEEVFRTSALDSKELTQRINKLVQICAIGQVTNGAYTVGPVIKFSMQKKKRGKVTDTGLYKNLVAVVNSVKYDVATDEASWDIDNMLPMAYNVSVDMNILSTTSGKLFNSSETFVG
jgi:hypothetical protein